MIPIEIENRIARYYLHNFLPTQIMEELESLLIPYFLREEEPSAEEIVQLAITFINDSLEYYD